jgi:hypothetical protein
MYYLLLALIYGLLSQSSVYINERALLLSLACYNIVVWMAPLPWFMSIVKNGAPDVACEVVTP